MYDRNVKSERIRTKLHVLDYEYICDRIAKFHQKILFITRVINIQILTTKYFSFQHSDTYCSQLNVFWEHVRGSLDQWWCQLLWALWDIRLHHSVLRWSRDKSQRPVLLRYFASSTATAVLPAIRGLSGDFFTFQQDNAPAHRARETVHLLTHETSDFITPTLWPANSPDLNPVDFQIWGKLQ